VKLDILLQGSSNLITKPDLRNRSLNASSVVLEQNMQFLLFPFEDVDLQFFTLDLKKLELKSNKGFFSFLFVFGEFPSWSANSGSRASRSSSSIYFSFTHAKKQSLISSLGQKYHDFRRIYLDLTVWIMSVWIMSLYYQTLIYVCNIGEHFILGWLTNQFKQPPAHGKILIS
jgi:hypothetical protein